MGMFNDHVAAQREQWKYSYTAKVMLPNAKRLLKHHGDEEMAARNKTAILMVDPGVSQNDTRFTDLKRAITTHGTLKEQLEVFVHEFERDPDVRYTLGLGDVTFFELTLPSKADDDRVL
ncbi:MAG TPA: hypothetical protein VII94_03515 [Candidatus Saccharimonadales bacterium]